MCGRGLATGVSGKRLEHLEDVRNPNREGIIVPEVSSKSKVFWIRVEMVGRKFGSDFVPWSRVVHDRSRRE